MGKEVVVYIHTMEYYSTIKRNTSESVLIRWMNLEPIIQSEVSQKEKILRRGGKNTQKNCTEKVFTTQIITMM